MNLKESKEEDVEDLERERERDKWYDYIIISTKNNFLS